MNTEDEWSSEGASSDELAIDTQYLLGITNEKILPFLSSNDFMLHFKEHKSFVIAHFETHLPFSSISYETSGPWLIYWSLLILTLLKEPTSQEMVDRSIFQLFQHCYIEKEGAFGGSSSCITSHILTTYAAISSLTLIGNPEQWSKINRTNLILWLKKLYYSKVGSFAVHIENGEMDLRSLYAAIAIVHLLGLEKEIFTSEFLEHIVKAILSCQTYEGGFGAIPWSYTEAHGGYSYCAISSLVILARWGDFDIPIVSQNRKNRLLNWIGNRQSLEVGGLQGRAGKLVDSCYSFWIGSLPSLLDVSTELVLDVSSLKRYLLSACQSPFGGMRDKPSKSADLYHTCYSLSGLSLIQDQRDGFSLALIDPALNLPFACIKKIREWFVEKYN